MAILFWYGDRDREGDVFPRPGHRLPARGDRPALGRLEVRGAAAGDPGGCGRPGGGPQRAARRARRPSTRRGADPGGDDVPGPPRRGRSGAPPRRARGSAAVDPPRHELPDPGAPFGEPGGRRAARLAPARPPDRRERDRLDGAPLRPAHRRGRPTSPPSSSASWFRSAGRTPRSRRRSSTRPDGAAGPSSIA